jgi:hypothetical protein
MWHYPGKVDTVSRVKKINGVHTHRSMVMDRIGSRSGGDEQKVMDISRQDCV